MAVENPPSVDEFPIKTFIYREFPVAVFDYRKVVEWLHVILINHQIICEILANFFQIWIQIISDILTTNVLLRNMPYFTAYGAMRPATPCL